MTTDLPIMYIGNTNGIMFVSISLKHTTYYNTGFVFFAIS